MFHTMGVTDGPPVGQHLPLDLAFPGLHRVHADPPVFVVDELLSTAECDALTRLADPMLTQSLPDGGASRARTSRSCHLRKGSQPMPGIYRRVTALLRDWPVSHMETPQVARYERGQFYEAHFDGSAPESRAYRGEEGGQRVATVLIYLNDVPRGGHTRFNRLGFEVAPRKGCAVVFFPGCADTGALDSRALHEARPAEDRKYVCQIWVRQRALSTAGQEFQGVGHRLLEALYAN